MTYLVFPTQALAQIAADQIARNMEMPIIGIGASSGNPHPNAQQTTAWAIPIQILGANGTEGSFNYSPMHPLFLQYPNQWAFPAPDPQYLTGVKNSTTATA